MGRTVPTFTMVIQQELESWSKFRRGLRLEDQEALDDLFRAARLQLASSAYAARPIPFESIAMSMLLAQQRLIRQMAQRIRHLDDRIAGLEAANALPRCGRPCREDDDAGAGDQRVAV